MTEYNSIKQGHIPIKRITQTGHKITLPSETNTYFIQIESTDNEFLDFLDKGIDKLISEYIEQI